MYITKNNPWTELHTFDNVVHMNMCRKTKLQAHLVKQREKREKKKILNVTLAVFHLHSVLIILSYLFINTRNSVKNLIIMAIIIAMFIWHNQF